MSLSRPLRQWWSRTSDQLLHQAQDRLLQALVQTPFTRLARGAHGLNVLEFVCRNHSRTASHKHVTLLLLHGFGSGLGFFAPNIDALLAEPTPVRRVVLMDWLGMGGSARPPCRRPIRGLTSCTTDFCHSRFDPTQAADFFTQPLHVWLQQPENVSADETVWTVGHSLGGYLLGRYVLTAKPWHFNLQKVVLASPVGFPTAPDVHTSVPTAEWPTAWRVVDALWSANVTPQQLIRLMGATRGRRVVQQALAGRIPHLTGRMDDRALLRLLADYLYHITVAHPSGEFAMNSLLQPGLQPNEAGVFAREPLAPLFETHHSGNLQWKVLFGDHDWMRSASNEKAAQRAMQIARGRICIVPNAGHHLYLENPNAFVEHILND